jgi:Leucine-rich repeat (LRR) protein
LLLEAIVAAYSLVVSKSMTQNCNSVKTIVLSVSNFGIDCPFPSAVLDDLSKLPAIEQIWLEINNISGTLPPSIGNATTLVVLSLGVSNDVGGPNLGQTGGFGGKIPEELGKLVNLNTLNLGGNNFTGGVPPEILSLSLLNLLDLGQINLTGEIPPWLGNMTSLTNLWLRGNELTGSIPPSLGKLVNLTWLDLTVNSLTGPILTASHHLSTWRLLPCLVL